jgi:Na+/H+-dicarboxylate symporter
MQSNSFSSHALVEPKQPFSISHFYFTSNPFHSLSNAVMPAVVLFSPMIGTASMSGSGVWKRYGC